MPADWLFGGIWQPIQLLSQLPSWGGIYRLKLSHEAEYLNLPYDASHPSQGLEPVLIMSGKGIIHIHIGDDENRYYVWHV